MHTAQLCHCSLVQLHSLHLWKMLWITLWLMTATYTSRQLVGCLIQLCVLHAGSAHQKEEGAQKVHEIGVSAGSVGEGVNHGLVVTIAEDCLALPVLTCRDHNGNQFQCGNILVLLLLAFYPASASNEVKGGGTQAERKATPLHYPKWSSRRSRILFLLTGGCGSVVWRQWPTGCTDIWWRNKQDKLLRLYAVGDHQRL